MAGHILTFPLGHLVVVSQRLMALVVVSFLEQSFLLWPSLREGQLQSHLLSKKKKKSQHIYRYFLSVHTFTAF